MSDYKVGIELAMSGNVEKFLGALSQRLLGVHGQVKEISKDLSNWGKLIGGLGAAFVGVEVLRGLGHLVEHGKELNHQQSMLLRNGIAYKDVIDQTSKIYQRYTQQVPTASGPDFLRAANELVSVKGTLAGADQSLVQSLKIEGLISNSTGKPAEGQGYDFWRTVEDKGIIQNKALTDKWLDAMVKGTMVTGGKVGGSEWFQYARRAMSSWNSDALESLPLQLMMMQTLSAPTAGTDRRMFARMIEGGQKLSKKQEAGFREVGMLDGSGKVVGRDMEITRPDQFMQFAIDHLNAHGKTSLEDVKSWATRTLNASSAAYFMTAWSGMTEKDASGKTRLDKERENIGRVGGLDASYATMMKSDFGANMEALNKQWNSFLEAAGGPLAKAAIPALQGLTNIVNQLGAAAQAHPDLTKIAGESAAAAAGLTAIAGAVVSLSAALKIGGWALGGSATASAARVAVAAEGGAATAAGVAGGGWLGGIPGLAIGGLLYYLSTHPMKFDPEGVHRGPKGAIMPNFSKPVDHGDGLVDSLKKIWHGLPDVIGKAHADEIKRIPEKINPAAKASMTKVGDQLNSSVAALPAQVNPAITSAFSSIGAALSSAISGLAGVAAKGGINKVELHVEGKKMAEVTLNHIRQATRSVTAAAGHDGRADWTHPEYADG